MNRRRWAWSSAAALALLAASIAWWQERDVAHYIDPGAAAEARFVARFPPPPAADSPAAHTEIEELLAMQAARTPEHVTAAQADRRTRVQKFYAALGLPADPAPSLPALERLAQDVEDDVRIRVRGAKEHFLRLRPYEVEPRIDPCIGGVRSDLSYPSGHSAFGWSMAYLLSMVAPERRVALEARAREYARQRMVCGVHFASDLEAGRLAARAVLDEIAKNREFQARLAAAAEEYRAATAARQPRG